MFSSFGLDGGLRNAQFRHVFVIRLNIPRRNRVAGYTFLVGSLDDLVIYICKVFYELDSISGILQIASYDIEYKSAPGMAQVRIVVDRHTAHVHADGLRHQRVELLFFSGERVIERQHRSAITPLSAGV